MVVVFNRVFHKAVDRWGFNLTHDWCQLNSGRKREEGGADAMESQT